MTIIRFDPFWLGASFSPWSLTRSGDRVNCDVLQLAQEVRGPGRAGAAAPEATEEKNRKLKQLVAFYGSCRALQRNGTVCRPCTGFYWRPFSRINPG